MRSGSPALLALVAALAACAGDDEVVIDAPATPSDAPIVDAPDLDAPDLDAPVADAPPPVDAPTDAPPADAVPGALPYLSIEPTPIELGMQEIGQPAVTRDVTISNLGGASTGVTLATSDSALVIVQDDCDTLAAGQSCTARVRIDTATPGAVTHELRALPSGAGNAALAPVTVTAGHRVNIEITGAGGTVVAYPSGLTCTSTCTGLIPGSSVTLHAEPGPGLHVRELVELAPAAGCTNPARPDCSVALTGPASFHATFVTPSLTVEQVGSGVANLTIDLPSGTLTTCHQERCTYDLPGGNATLSLQVPQIEGSGFTGWSGPCSGVQPCTVSLASPTTVTAHVSALAPQTWMRSVHDRIPLGLAATTDGVIVAGQATTQNPQDAAIWVARYDAGGAVTSSFENPSPGWDSGTKLAADPGGGFYLLVGIDGALWLRRYADVGILTWAVPLPAPASGLAADAAGNVYVALADELRSYTPTAILRWRTAAAGAEHLSVAGDTVGVGGNLGAYGWVAGYNRFGVEEWHHDLAQFLQVRGVAVDSTGTVQFLQQDVDRFAMNRASAASPPAPGGGGTEGTRATFALTPENVGVILLTSTAGNTLVVGRPTNISFRDTGLITFDAAGAMYLAGQGSSIPFHTLIVRNQ
jgi:hypothetical protein